MSERSIAPAVKAPVPVLSQVPTRVLQRKCACGQHTMGGECEGCRKNRSTLQRKSAGGRVASVPPIVSDVLRSPGQPLDPGTRAFYEPKFGHDFSGVRVHTGPRAAASAAAVDAMAYTVGTNIVFGEGKFGSTRSDHGLLSHELAHVVQQSGSASGYSGLAVSHDMTAERQADHAAAQVSAGHRVGPLSAAIIPSVQREEAPKPAPAELNWFEKGLIEAAAAPALSFGDTVHAMVKATLRGFLVEVKTQAPARGEELWNHVKEAFEHPTELGKFLLRYWWGLIKGIFSPITGLFDLAVLVGKLSALPGQILDTIWARRSELASEAGNLGSSLGKLGARVRDAIRAFKESPLQTVKALGPWFSSLQDNAIAAAESGGHQAGAALMAQAGKPLPELGETAGEVIGTVLINVVLLVFTDGIGNAIAQVATRLGEFGAFLGKFGKAAQMLGQIAAKVGELLLTVGVFISKAEAAFAKAAETVLKPIAPLMEELGNLMKGLRSFLRKLLGVSTEEVGAAAEQLAGKAGTALEEHLVPPGVRPPAAKPGVPAPKPALRSLPKPPPEPAASAASRTTARVGRNVPRAISGDFFDGSAARDVAGALAEAPKEPVLRLVPDLPPEPLPAPGLPAPAPVAPPAAPPATAVKSGGSLTQAASLVGKAVGTATAPAKDDPKKTRPPFVLWLPQQKAPHLETYRSWLGRLQSDPNYERGNPPQRREWHKALRGGGSNPIPQSVYERGHKLGLAGREGEDRIRIPNWSRRSMEIAMEVDHIVELQLTPAHMRREFDSIFNWELLDRKSNGDSGNLLKNNIARERAKQVAFDPSTKSRVLLFDDVQLDGGTPGERWIAKELQDGEQLDAYEKHR